MKRFNLETHNDTLILCVEDSHGNWVKWEDVEELISYLEKVNKHVQECLNDIK